MNAVLLLPIVAGIVLVLVLVILARVLPFCTPSSILLYSTLRDRRW